MRLQALLTNKEVKNLCSVVGHSWKPVSFKIRESTYKCKVCGEFWEMKARVDDIEFDLDEKTLRESIQRAIVREDVTERAREILGEKE